MHKTNEEESQLSRKCISMEIVPEQWKMVMVKIHESTSSAQVQHEMEYTVSNADTHAQIKIKCISL